jgi:Na+/H+ antiporter NhaD/arsenite permease-like protein
VISTPPATLVEAAPSPWMLLPFGILLFLIAVLPLNAPRFWEKMHPWAAGALGTFSAAYYSFQLGKNELLWHTAREFLSFITLIGSLYLVCGGIHVRVKGEATPLTNCALLLLGAVLANLVGTTGASLLLIRPWIRMNKYRVTDFHIVFFIFLVSNLGGLLSPVGDPPLFLGYLKGIPFWWVARHCWPVWVFGVSGLLAVFYFLDRRNFLRAPQSIRDEQTATETWKVSGWRNIALLAAVQGGLLLPDGWREAGFVGIALAAWRITPRHIHEANDFDLHPLREVAWLFAGLFATMLPALDLLQIHAGDLGLREPLHFYWATGLLSAVLDNAPTYLAFLSAAFGLAGLDLQTDMATFHRDHAQMLRAISTGAVFFGAMTYLGNGPNLMVKQIARQQKVSTPSFGAYIWKFSLPVLLPLLALIGALFFRS